jgi:hypothetical protein
MSGPIEFTLEWGYSVVVDQDEKVAYAYLRHNGRIIGDVWLFNVQPTPAEPEWRDRRNAPFLNPADFVVASQWKPHVSSLEVTPTLGGDRELANVQVKVEGRVLAVLKPGAKPGWSANAIKPGPLAKPLDSLVV